MFFWRSGWFVDELLLDFRLVWIWGGVGRSWCRGVMENDGSGIGYWWVWWCDFQSSRWLCFQRSLGRMRRGDRVVVLLRLMMLDVELVVNLYRSSRAFSRNCCVFGIIVRFADWLIDFYLKWCGVWWWCRLFWIGNLNNVRGGCRSRQWVCNFNSRLNQVEVVEVKSSWDCESWHTRGANESRGDHGIVVIR